MMKDICVIGAGAAGLCAARYLTSHPDMFKVRVFEQTSTVGGTWNYTDAVNSDRYGLPIHSSMYKNLRTNLPKEVMAFPDFAFPSHWKSFMRHEEVQQYLEDYARHFNLLKHIKFTTLVERVHPVMVSPQNGKVTWEVTVRELEGGTTSTAKYDAVMVCNGHYSEPLIPEIPGLESFPGLIMHSHSYRRPDIFRGLDVVVLGAKASGSDISLDISGVAHSIYLSHGRERLRSKLPHNVEQTSAIHSVSSDGTVHFENGEQHRADAILFCTGYKFSFPFLSEECKTEVINGRVSPLYKHLFHPSFFGSLSFLGLCVQVCPFPLFSVQARYVVSVLNESKRLPSEDEMRRDAERDLRERLESGLLERHAHLMESRQWGYNDELARLAGCDQIDRMVQDLYTYLTARRKIHLMTYKDDDYRLTPGVSWEKVQS